MLARKPSKDKESIDETIMFRPNSQFLICKVEKDHEMVEVWVREVQIGLSDVNALWIDENIFVGDTED